MENKELSRLRRVELMKMVTKQQKENDRLRQELADTRHELKKRRVEERVLAKKRLKAGRRNPEDVQEEEWLDDEDEPDTEKSGKVHGRTMRYTISTVVTVVAVAALIAVLLMPVLRIYGASMSPTLTEGDFVVSIKGSRFDAGDVVAFYYNNNILVKRVVARAGDWVDIAADGTVYVNYQELDEPYLSQKALGECNIELPYQVPESRIFVMGDSRDVSVDSRNTAVGCVAEEQIVGKVIFRVWPLNEFGIVR